MNTVKSFAALIAVGLIAGAGSASAESPSAIRSIEARILEVVVVRAAAPAPALEEVVVVARRRGRTEARMPARAEPTEVRLGVERPQVELASGEIEIRAARPTLSL